MYPFVNYLGIYTSKRFIISKWFIWCGG
jgi:hypothetical protein